MNSYCYRITQPVTAEITSKGSKFIAYAYPVNNQTDIEDCLRALKRTHPKARHYCYAYRLGATGEEWRANDDGEPSGTAGLPIYNQLQSFEISNTVLIVVRYFGGTLLGASGLIRAYKQASEQALSLATKRRIIPKRQLRVCLPYAEVNRLMQIIAQWEMRIIEQNMDMSCIYTLECRCDDYEMIIDNFARTEITLLPST